MPPPFAAARLALAAIAATWLWVAASGSAAAQAPTAPVQPSAPSAERPVRPIPFTRDEFVIANVIHTVWHEFGHALISLFNIPVLGREEDAVEDLATLLILRAPDRAAGLRVLEAVGWGWYLSFESARGERPAYWDAHSLDLQRLYAIACLVYGSDPMQHSAMADQVRLPNERREECVEEHRQRLDSWRRVTASFAVGPDRAARAPRRQGSRQPRNRARLVVQWREPQAELRELVGVLRRSGMIEAMARDINGRVRLPRRIALRMEHCGEENAYWDADERAIIICYEFFAYNDRLYREHERRLAQ